MTSGMLIPSSASSGRVLTSRLVVAKPDDDRNVEGFVGRTVAPAVQAVTVGLARARRDWRYPAQPGKGGFRPKPVRVVTDGHQQG